MSWQRTSDDNIVYKKKPFRSFKEHTVHMIKYEDKIEFDHNVRVVQYDCQSRLEAI